MEVRYEYGVLAAASKARVCGTGVPFRPVATRGPARIVHYRASGAAAQQARDVWAKVSGSELVEVLGRTGDPTVEARALRLHYGVQPCRYPDHSEPLAIPDAWDGAEAVDGAFTVDNACTLDRDDALSWSPAGDGGVLGVHITEVAARLPSELRAWALARGASAYWAADGVEDGGHESAPMLPPRLAHAAFSLSAGPARHPCRSLFLSLGCEGRVLGARFARTWVRVAANLTYEQLGSEDMPEVACLRAALARLAGTGEPAEQVAAAMVAYNTRHAELLRASFPEGLLRVQASPDGPASYEHAGGDAHATHAAMGGALYTHLTSPIRRYADLHNQAVLGALSWARLSADELRALNARCSQLAAFHAHEEAFRFALECKAAPRIVEAALEAGEDGRFLRVHVPGRRRARVPLYGSFYAEPVAEEVRSAPRGSRFVAEMHGILSAHRGATELRVRWLGGLDPEEDPLPLPAATAAPVRGPALRGKGAAAQTPQARTEAHMEALLGYPLDAFQRRCFEVLAEGRCDLLATAPTGSGKTVIALQALVMCAFDRGLRAVLTTPIKALSNQKFKEFDAWVRRLLGVDECRVTLLTGDIQARATPPGGDGRPELLIMTSEILANKLEASYGGAGAAPDPDLLDVGAVLMDEVHYINDPERGHVWERTLVHLPPDVAVVALSATLDQAQRFADWMSKRRETRLVQRLDRHVPLHLGMYGADGEFGELYCTHGGRAALATAEYDRLRRGARQWQLPQLLHALERDDKLPAIVFFLSRARCVSAAESVKENLLLGAQVAPRAKGECEYAHAYKAEVQQDKCREMRRRQQQLFRRHLLPYQAVLRHIPGLDEFMGMLERGVAYHHSGMLPLLREYVEMLFHERLLRVVFATESLGIGINMPCRTVVFGQLEKPDGREGGGFRMLRTDEFWQMAGRAGRRGMDEHGYVVYAPMVREPAPAHELAALLGSRPPAARSQLRVDPVFVLRQRALIADADGRVLSRTLRHHELAREADTLQKRAAAGAQGGSGGGNGSGLDDEALVCRALGLHERLHPAPGCIFRLTPLQRKRAVQELADLERTCGLATPVDWKAVAQAVRERSALAREIASCRSCLSDDWQKASAWLLRHGFLAAAAAAAADADADADAKTSALPTAKGRAAAMFADGEPLIRGTLVAGGALEGCVFEDVAAWLAGFAERVPLQRGAPLPGWDSGAVSPALRRLWGRTREVAEALGRDADACAAWGSAFLVDLWLRTRDVRQVAGWVDTAQLGSFVRLVLRVAACVEELRGAALGLEDLALYNVLEGAEERLYHGVVTNRSLYVASA